uniref:Secreted protein n=1 Tax=Thraustotheca clavata TaxID=74557 RepID=A0A0A7CME6_9STRA|nr:secreted protein [Thraustotheca clavata]
MVKSIVIAASFFQATVAIDYLGGWIEPAHQQCVDICKNSKATPGCFGPADDACHKKLQRPGDYDYLMLDQIYQPQFCRDLLNGVDSTITHQNVNKYPNVKSELMIHGLWPDYINGYPGCCNVTDTIINQPFDASKFSTKYPDLFKEMTDEWVDPSIGNSTEQLCQGYNHEFQKHGICYGAFNSDFDLAAKQYFKAVLDVNTRLKSKAQQIAKWATASATPTTTIADIAALYPKNINILCSTVSGEKPNRLVSVRTCFDKSPPLKDNCNADDTL